MLQPPDGLPEMSDETIGGMPTEHPHCSSHASDDDVAEGGVDSVPVGAASTAAPE